MKKIYLSSFLICTILYCFSSQTRKVLLIGIDGVRVDALQQANTPYIDALLNNATYTYDSWHTGITWSGPSWSTILTGVNWNKHGVTDNSFTGKQFNTYAPLPTLAKQIKPNLNSTIVAEWDPLIDDINNAVWDRTVKVADGSNWPTADSAVAELQNPDIDLLFTYFDKVDLTGHTTTFSASNPLYISAIQDVDSAIGRVLNALYARPTYSSEDWLILVITDHGGTSFFHGGNSDAERHIWWIASGNAVAHQQFVSADPGTYNCNSNSAFDSSCVNETLLFTTPSQTDITVTALHHLIYDSGIHPETKPDWDLDGKSWLINPNLISEYRADKNLMVYPNPASDVLTIEGMEVNSEEWPLEVFSAEGKKIYSVVPLTNKVKIQTQNFATGMCLVKYKNKLVRIIVGRF